MIFLVTVGLVGSSSQPVNDETYALGHDSMLCQKSFGHSGKLFLVMYQERLRDGVPKYSEISSVQ